MKQSKDYKKIFEEIYSSREFDRLGFFTEAKEWEPLTEEEKELLGVLFVMQGEKQLSEGNNQVLESFRIANAISPNNPRILYRQALAFSNQSQNLFCLKTACKIFESAIEIKPDFFDAWHGLGNALVLIGTINLDSNCLVEAINKYKQAETFAETIGTQKLAGFYKDLALCWYTSGKLSGEPQDYRNSLNNFQKCSRLGLNTPQFWNDYGNAIGEVAQLLNKPKMIIEGIELYWRAIKITPNFQAAWYNLATSLKILYQFQPLDAYYAFANESFDQVSKFEPQNPTIWMKWGELQAFRGKMQRDLQILKLSCKKFEIADICEPNHSVILGCWGETLLLMASWTEDLEILEESFRKIHKSLEIQKDNPRVWFLYGSCLNEYGKYFHEEKHFLDAIEKFQLGLQIDPKEPLLWYGIGLSFFALGQYRDDDTLVYEASQYFMKAIELGGESTPQFWNDWGLSLMRLSGMTDEKSYLESAINKFEQALRLSKKSGVKDPGDIDKLYNLGCAYELLGDYEVEVASYEKAAQLFKKVLELDPEFHSVFFNLACVCSRIGEITGDIESLFEANRFFEKAINTDPEDDQAWNEWGVSLVNIAEITSDPLRPDLSQKFFAEAEKNFHLAAGLGNLSALYHLACLYSLTENYDEAIHFLEKCTENNALPRLEDLIEDEWLRNLRQTSLFGNFLSQIERNDYS